MDRFKIDKDFAKIVMSCTCPNCGENFTDGACDWGQAWLEGRIDLLDELGSTERCGPYKVKCEWCDSKSFIDYFAKRATLTK